MTILHHKRNTIIAIPLIALLLFVSIFVLVRPAAAAEVEYESGWQIIPKECLGRQAAGDTPCDLNSFINLFVNLAKVGLKILPYLTMIMMIWAGFNLIMAGGNTQKIEEGKRMISSVVVGAIIILFLAWCYSYFIVFVMTGSAKVFPNYPWEKEWWGGGTATSATATLGCCVNTTAKWCQEQTEETDCEAQGGQYQGNGSTCTADATTYCANYALGCCVPDNPTDTNCQYASSIGACKDMPGYHNVTDQTCLDIAQCVAGSLYSAGCCVPDVVPGGPGVWQDCHIPQQNILCDSYPGTTFRQNLGCNNFPICKSGCCVPYCGTATSNASEYWCNTRNGVTTWHSGTCNDQETDVANCCSIPLGVSNEYRCLSADGGNQINRQHCLNLGGEYDTANCNETGHVCLITETIDNAFCTTH